MFFDLPLGLPSTRGKKKEWTMSYNKYLAKHARQEEANFH